MPIVGNPLWLLAGANPKYAWTQYSKFISSGLGSSNWTSTDGTKTITRESGTWTVTDGKLIANGSTRYRTPAPNSYILIGIRCSIDSSFVPKTDSRWFYQSCITGKEMSDVQKDYGLILYTVNGVIYPGIGYDRRSYELSTVPMPIGEDCDLFLLAASTSLHLFLNGSEVVTLAYTLTGNNFTQIGIFWNDNSGGSTVKGTISAYGIWTYTDVGGTQIILPSLD